MRYLCFIWFCSLSLAYSSSLASTLDEFYQSALLNTPTINNKNLALEIAEKQKRQAYASILPTLTLQSTNLQRQEVNAGAFGEANQQTNLLNLSQPLFQGGANFYALPIAKRLPKIAEWDKKITQINLYSQIAESYFQLERYTNEIQNLKDQKETLEKRLKTLRNRVRIGRNKVSDVLAAETSHARLLADLSQTEGLYSLAKRQLEFQSGKVAQELQPTPLDFPIDPNWKDHLADAPTVKKLELELANAKDSIGIAGAEYYPDLDLEANYYFNRAGVLADSKWDLTLSASWEIYSGGNDSAEKRIQLLSMKQLEAELEYRKRNLSLEYSSTLSILERQKQALTRLTKALEYAERNYQEHIRESNQGLISQLEVLRSLEDLLTVKRSIEMQKFQTKTTWVKLRALAGVIP